MRLPLTGMDGASAELICHAADADIRALAFGVPALAASAATPTARGGGGGGGAAEAAGSGGGGGGMAAAQQQQQQQQQEQQRWSILKQLSLRRRAPVAATAPPATPPDGSEAGGAGAGDDDAPPRSPFPARQAAAAAARAAAQLAELPPSPIAGLPNSLAGKTPDGPLARLRLTLHRADLAKEPARGYALVLKCGVHWARSRPRRSSELEWQLEVRRGARAQAGEGGGVVAATRRRSRATPTAQNADRGPCPDRLHRRHPQNSPIILFPPWPLPFPSLLSNPQPNPHHHQPRSRSTTRPRR